MTLPSADVVLVRFGEIGTKSQPVRRRMIETLLEHVEALLGARDVTGRPEYDHARPLIHVSADEAEAAARTAADAFGVVSASPARRVDPEREAILEALAQVAPSCYESGAFAVEARRATDEPDFISPELEREGGRVIWEAVEGDLDPVVDLDDPDVRFGIEVRQDDAFVFVDRYPGPGGLPLGSQHRVIALISGGIDSPVAAYEAMRRGSRIVPVYLDLGDFGGPDHRARATAAVRQLTTFDPDLSGLYVVPAGQHVAYLAEHMDRGRMLSFRRFMFRIAEKIASRADARGIVTGEAIGQKSSQTVANLALTSAGTELPIHRPLLTADKTDITERAREIGTLRESTIPAGCNRFAPDHPETAGRLDRLRTAEPDDLFDRADRAAQAAEWFTV